MEKLLKKSRSKIKFPVTAVFVFLLAVLTLLFLRNVLFFHGDFIIQGSDLVQTYYQKFIYRAAFLNGRLPLWNPYLYCGYPYLAHPYNGTFYPLNLLFLLMPINIAYSWIFAVHVFLSGLFMFFLVRYLVRDKWAAVTSAICFMFSGYTATRIWAGHYEVYASSIWIPLIFLLFLKSIRKKSILFSAFTGLCLAIQFFAGHTQTFFFTVMILACYVLYQCIIKAGLLPEKTVPDMLKSVFPGLKFFILTMLFFGLIAAVQFIPTFEMIKYSTRGNGTPFFMSVYGSFPPEHLIRFLFPDFFGNILKTLYAGDPLVGEIHWEFTYYIGVLPLLMAVYIVFKKMSEKTRRISMLLIGSVALISGLTRGLFLKLWHIRNNPAVADPVLLEMVRFFEKVYSSQLNIAKLIPVFAVFLGILIALVLILKRALVDNVQNTRKNNNLVLFFGIICFIGILLSFGQYAPFGLYYIFYKFVPGYSSFKWPARHLIISNFALCVLVGYWMKGLAKHKIAKLAVVLIILLDLFLYTGKFFYLKNLNIFYPDKRVVQALNKDKDLFRVLILPVVKPGCIFEPSCVEFQANACIPLNLYNIGGYDPMILRRYHELTNALQENRLDDFGNTSIRIKDLKDKKTLNLLNAKYIFSSKDVEGYQLGLSADNVIREFDKSCLLAVDDSAKRFNYVSEAIIAESDNDILKIIQGDDFNPLKTVVLEHWQEPVALSLRTDENGHETKIEVINYNPNQIDLKIRARDKGYISTSEVFYPGWRVFVNGTESRIYRSNYAMRAVYIPKAGEYKVQFRFNPESLKTGMITSLTSIMLIFIFAVICVLKRKRANSVV